MLISTVLRNIHSVRSFQYLTHIDLHAINAAFHEFNTAIFLHQMKISELEAKINNLQSNLAEQNTEPEKYKLEDEMSKRLALRN